MDRGGRKEGTAGSREPEAKEGNENKTEGRGVVRRKAGGGKSESQNKVYHGMIDTDLASVKEGGICEAEEI